MSESEQQAPQPLDYQPPAEQATEPPPPMPRWTVMVFFGGIMAVAMLGMVALIRSVIGVLWG
jgi:hypothetical protein